MAKDKEVQLDFKYSDGTVDTVKFLVPAGEDGKDGENGNSAYEDAVAEGFEGTREEWLLSLRGADGKDGADGKNGADGKDGDPASVCDSFTTLPTSDEFGDDPQIIVRSGGACRVVNVPSKGIFTDIRSQAAWSGIALVGDTNTFVATARNVSVTDAGKVRVDIVLPTIADDGATYGVTAVSASNGITVTPIITTGANRSYYIENLKSGANVNFNTPVTWNVQGTYQASVTVNAVDPNTVDYSSSDDYSVATYTVAPKSDGEATIDCPLISGKIGTTDLAIGSVPSDHIISPTVFIPKCLGIVLDEERSFEVEFDRPVTIYAMVTWGGTRGVYDVQQNINGYGGLTYNATSSTNDVTITPLDGTNTKFKITFLANNAVPKGFDIQTLACFGIKAGANCNTQYFGVNADAGYRIGQTIAVTNNGATEPVYNKTSQFSNNSLTTYDIRHVDGTTHQLIVGDTNKALYKVEGLHMTLLEATPYDLTIASIVTPTTLLETKLITQETIGAVTISYPDPKVNTVHFVASDNTSDHDSTTNGLLKYTFVQE